MEQKCYWASMPEEFDGSVIQNSSKKRLKKKPVGELIIEKKNKNKFPSSKLYKISQKTKKASPILSKSSRTIHFYQNNVSIKNMAVNALFENERIQKLNEENHKDIQQITFPEPPEKYRKVDIVMKKLFTEHDSETVSQQISEESSQEELSDCPEISDVSASQIGACTRLAITESAYNPARTSLILSPCTSNSLFSLPSVRKRRKRGGFCAQLEKVVKNEQSNHAIWLHTKNKTENELSENILLYIVKVELCYSLYITSCLKLPGKAKQCFYVIFSKPAYERLQLKEQSIICLHQPWIQLKVSGYKFPCIIFSNYSESVMNAITKDEIEFANIAFTPTCIEYEYDKELVQLTLDYSSYNTPEIIWQTSSPILSHGFYYDVIPAAEHSTGGHAVNIVVVCLTRSLIKSAEPDYSVLLLCQDSSGTMCEVIIPSKLIQTSQALNILSYCEPHHCYKMLDVIKTDRKDNLQYELLNSVRHMVQSKKIYFFIFEASSKFEAVPVDLSLPSLHLPYFTEDQNKLDDPHLTSIEGWLVSIDYDCLFIQLNSKCHKVFLHPDLFISLPVTVLSNTQCRININLVTYCKDQLCFQTYRYSEILIESKNKRNISKAVSCVYREGLPLNLGDLLVVSGQLMNKRNANECTHCGQIITHLTSGYSTCNKCQYINVIFSVLSCKHQVDIFVSRSRSSGLSGFFKKSKLSKNSFLKFWCLVKDSAVHGLLMKEIHTDMN